jgi:hypothetical protein
MPAFTVHSFQNLGCAIRSAAMVGGITGEAWSRDKGNEAGITNSSRITVCVISGAADTDIQLDLGFAYTVSGRRDEARRTLAKRQMHQQGVVPYASVAILYGALGESSEAFAWLEKAYEERDPQLIYLKAGRRFEPLRKDPRFGQFVRPVGLPD